MKTIDVVKTDIYEYLVSFQVLLEFQTRYYYETERIRKKISRLYENVWKFHPDTPEYRLEKTILERYRNNESRKKMLSIYRSIGVYDVHIGKENDPLVTNNSWRPSIRKWVYDGTFTENEAYEWYDFYGDPSLLFKGGRIVVSLSDFGVSYFNKIILETNITNENLV
jgi:hypothetical protein